MVFFQSASCIDFWSHWTLRWDNLSDDKTPSWKGHHVNYHFYPKLLCISSLLFVWFDSFRPINYLSVKQGRVFLGWTSTNYARINVFCSRTTMQWCRWGSNPQPLGQALYHWATALPYFISLSNFILKFKQVHFTSWWNVWMVVCSGK